MGQDCSCPPGEHIVSWLLRCWDRGAKQLGSFSGEGGTEKALANGAQALSLWRRRLAGVKERDPFKEDAVGLLRLEEQTLLAATSVLQQRSIVSTLLTLMDGTDNRGEIVVIGATNRLDSIDPALRRPGRFGREFLFNLPNKEARKEIFKIHTRDWTPKPPDMLLDELAEKCIGYCGADIKSLCTEAALCSLRRCYPQIYASREKLLLDVNSIKIKAKDFFMALKKVVPASNRIVASPGQALSPIFKPLFKRSGANILQVVQKIFPHAQLALKEDRQQDHLNPILQDDTFDSDDDASLVSGDELKEGMPDRPEKKRLCFSRSAFCEPTSRRPRLLIVGKEGYGQVSYVAPVVLHALEKFPVHTLDLSVLLTNVAPPEEICRQLIRNAQKTAPSIIYVPDIHLWWDNVGPALKLTFLTLTLPAFSPVLLLATSDVRHSDLPEEIQKLFNKEFGEVCNIELPGRAERAAFFEDLIPKSSGYPPVLGEEEHCNQLKPYQTEMLLC
nr:ATPase family AAA domain-containing protein 2-like [Anas platyrhynchos]